MKRFKLLLFQLFTLSVLFATAQERDPLDATAAGFRDANVKALVALMKPSVDIELPGREGPVPKAQAGSILARFFAENKPSGVSIIHRINSNPKFRHGVLSYTSGVKYRISLSIENVDGRFLIQGIRVERE